MNLNGSHLTAFAAVLREGSFEAAARRLYVTPSAVSQRLRQLEDQLGQILIVRGAPCRATPAGQTLLRHAIQVELLEHELLGNLGVETPDTPTCLRVAVAVNADSLDGWFLSAMETASARADILFDVRVEDQEHSASLLREGKVMAAVSASADPIQGCAVEALGNMRYLALASPSFQERYFFGGVSALARAPMLVFNAKDRLQTAFIADLLPDAVTPPSHFLPSTYGFIYAARKGLGWGMIPEHMAQPYISAGELVEIVPQRYIDVRLFWHRWNLDSPLLALLSDSVRAAARQQLRP